MSDAPLNLVNESAATPSAVFSHYSSLYNSSAAVLQASLTGENEALHADNHAFIADLALWIECIELRREVILLEAAAREYQYALLALVLGHYRHSFSSLRLFIELSLSTVRFSAQELLLREWLASKRDVNWRRLIHPEKGIFSPRFTGVFCPDLKDEAVHVRTIVTKLYRECSEYVHGNLSATRTIPTALAFDESLFQAWHERAKSARLVISFALFLRYFDDLSQSQQARLESSIREHLEYLEPVRMRFGSATMTP